MTATRATALFDQLAPVYDEVLPFFAGFAQQHMAWLAPAPGTRVLDLGAGRGALTAAALARGCRVTAVDCAPGMVERLAAQYPQVHEARVMDVHRLDFPDGSFDLVCAGFVVHLLDDPAAAAREIRRVLAPGGVFSFSVPGDVEDAPEWEFYGALFREFQPLIPEGQGRLSRPLDAERLLTAAGFTGASGTAMEQRLPVPDADTFWAWGLSHGSRAYFDALPADARTEFEARVRAELSTMDPIVFAAGARLWRGTSPGRRLGFAQGEPAEAAE
ncbi:class I SAM-dependent methyltransferase [Streptomyces drozdowiczii]